MTDTGESQLSIHIRRQAAKGRGRGSHWYKQPISDEDPQRQMLCGAPAGTDMSWAETRWPRYLAFVTCDECKTLRGGAL